MVHTLVRRHRRHRWRRTHRDMVVQGPDLEILGLGDGESRGPERGPGLRDPHEYPLCMFYGISLVATIGIKRKLFMVEPYQSS
jgi:hypothetical protein